MKTCYLPADSLVRFKMNGNLVPLTGLPLTSLIHFPSQLSRSLIEAICGEKLPLWFFTFIVTHLESPDKSLETRRNPPVLWMANVLSYVLNCPSPVHAQVRLHSDHHVMHLTPNHKMIHFISITTSARLAYSVRWWGGLKTKLAEKYLKKETTEVREE